MNEIPKGTRLYEITLKVPALVLAESRAAAIEAAQEALLGELDNFDSILRKGLSVSTLSRGTFGDLTRELPPGWDGKSFPYVSKALYQQNICVNLDKALEIDEQTTMEERKEILDGIPSARWTT